MGTALLWPRFKGSQLVPPLFWSVVLRDVSSIQASVSKLTLDLREALLYPDGWL